MEKDCLFVGYSRREMLAATGKGAALFLVGGALALEGCGPLDAIATWIPIGIDALNTIVSLVDPPLEPIVAPIATLIKVGFADLAAAIDDYENAPASDKATWLAKIKTLLAAIGKEFQNFVIAVSNTPGLAAIVKLVAVIIDTLAGFSGQLGITGAVPVELRAGDRIFVTVHPTKRDRKQFIAAFNAALDSIGHSEKHIPSVK